MKFTVKIILLLGVTAVLCSLIVWLRHHPLTPHSTVVETPQQARSTEVSRLARPVPAAPIVAARAVTGIPDKIPDSLQSILAPVVETPFAERVKTLRALPPNLTVDEIHSFYTFLSAPAQVGSDNREYENWLRNGIMDKLVQAPALPAGLPQLLLSIYQDPAQDIVMRDYAVQHIVPVYPHASTEEKGTLQQMLWQATEETGSSIAGTALLALHDLAQDRGELDPNKIGGTALKVAGDDRYGELSRITALQICGRMGVTQAEPLILGLTQNAGSVPLQISAIAALGDIGNEKSRNHLRQLALQAEPRLMPALASALKKLNLHLGI